MNLADFKKEAKKRGICELLDDWDNANSKKQLMDIALSIRGIEYLSRAIAEKWGPAADYIFSEFEPFNNGKYIRNTDGYTSAMYCRTTDPEIGIETTVALIIGYNGTIRVNRPCELYIVDSDCEIIGNADCRTYAYLFNSHVKSANVFIIDKKD